MSIRRGGSILRLVLLAGLVGTTQADAPAKPRKPKPFTVMSRNLYLGADVTPALEALASGDENAVPVAVAGVWNDVLATDWRTRVKALAREIRRTKPLLVGLQEAVIWRSQFPADLFLSPATHVEFDFAADLVAELRRQGQRYEAVAVAEGSDVELPRLREDGLLEDLRLTDRDVILARKGVDVAAVRTGTFETLLVLPLPTGDFPIPRQWAALDATVRGRTFRFVSVHLEADDEGVRRAQAAELVDSDGPATTSLPLVLLGDFNADAATGEATYTDLVGGGLVDAWSVTHSGEPGLTWGHAALLDNAAPTLTQRIDFVFLRGALEPVSSTLLGEEPSDRIAGRLWPSDHVGLAVKVRVP